MPLPHSSSDGAGVEVLWTSEPTCQCPDFQDIDQTGYSQYTMNGVCKQPPRARRPTRTRSDRARIVSESESQGSVLLSRGRPRPSRRRHVPTSSHVTITGRHRDVTSSHASGPRRRALRPGPASVPGWPGSLDRVGCLAVRTCGSSLTRLSPCRSRLVSDVTAPTHGSLGRDLQRPIRLPGR
jgi:hypothetical protein